MHTEVSSVQFFGAQKFWPEHVVYVGMPGRAQTAFGITMGTYCFGKPWSFLEDPKGWERAYLDYLVDTLRGSTPFREAVRNLHGKTLLCWCASKQKQRGTEVKCHARILAEFVELLYHEQD
jgi:hypothetical protein